MLLLPVVLLAQILFFHLLHRLAEAAAERVHQLQEHKKWAEMAALVAEGRIFPQLALVHLGKVTLAEIVPLERIDQAQAAEAVRVQ